MYQNYDCILPIFQLYRASSLKVLKVFCCHLSSILNEINTSPHELFWFSYFQCLFNVILCYCCGFHDLCSFILGLNVWLTDCVNDSSFKFLKRVYINSFFFCILLCPCTELCMPEFCKETEWRMFEIEIWIISLEEIW